MQRFFSTEKGSMMRSIALSLVFSTLFIAVSVVSATTISTSITTGGDLSVTGTSALTGLTTMVYGSSTSQSLSTNLMVGGRATTTGSSGNLEVYGVLTVGNATANSLAGTILLAGYTTASEPTGVTQGTFYYNSTNKTLKMFDGSNWFTVGTTTGGLSLNTNNIRLDDVTLRNLTLGTTTQPSAGKALVTLEATTTASIPLSLVGFSGQTAHLLDILNGTSVAGPKLLYISSNGGLFASSTGAFGGTLTVGGELTATSTLVVTGRADLNGQASTTRLSVFDRLYVGGTSTTTIVGGGSASTLPYASSTSFSTSVASTTNLTLGAGSTLAGMIFGTCDIAQTSITASTTAFRNCAAATGITTAYKVFVQATSSLATGVPVPVGAGAGFVIVSASSTAVNTISVEISNLT